MADKNKTIDEVVKESVAEGLKGLRDKAFQEEEKITEIKGGVKVVEKEIKNKAFGEFLRTGKISEKALEMTGAVGENGGFTIPENMYGAIIEKAKDLSVMREFAHIEPISLGRSMEFILEDGAFDSEWVAEGDAREDSAVGTFKNVTIDTHENWARPVISRQLVNDSMYNLENYLATKVAQKFAKSEELAFWKGTGVKQPTGLLLDVVGDYTDAINYANLNAMIYTLEDEYAQNGVFFMNRATMATVKGLVDTNGRPLFVETSDISNKFDGYLLGYPVKFTSALEKDKEIVFGDMYKAYGIVDKVNDNGVIRDEVTVPGKVKFNTWERVGGKGLLREAFQYIKLA